MKHLYSSLNHASYWYAKYWQDTFSVFAAKVLIAKDPMAAAMDQLLVLHHEVLETTKAAPAEAAAACEAAAAEAVALADMPADGGYLAFNLPEELTEPVNI
jgi:hypothetical protein